MTELKGFPELESERLIPRSTIATEKIAQALLNLISEDKELLAEIVRESHMLRAVSEMAQEICAKLIVQHRDKIESLSREIIDGRMRDTDKLKIELQRRVDNLFMETFSKVFGIDQDCY